MNSKRMRGHCLCGAVTVTADAECRTFDACHCGMCRRWGGGPALTVDLGTKVEFAGEEFIATYQSSDWAERGFCKRCGTHLFYRLKDGSFCNFSLDIFDGAEHLQFQTQIFIDCKPSHYEFGNQTGTMTEAQVIAKFNSPTA